MAGRIVDPLVTAIAADFAAPVAIVALLASAYTMPFSFSQPFLGPVGDALGKSLLIRISVAVLAVCLLACALAPNLTSLFWFRIFAGIAGAGILPISFALIGDTFALAVRQVALSRFLGATLIGQLVGASAAGIIAEMIGWRGVLGLCAGLACLAALVGWLWLPRSQEPSQPINIPDAISRYRLVLRNPRSYVCFSAVCLEGAAIYGVTPFIGNVMQGRGHIGGFGVDEPRSVDQLDRHGCLDDLFGDRLFPDAQFHPDRGNGIGPFGARLVFRLACLLVLYGAICRTDDLWCQYSRDRL
ncbi:MAG: MFS transporter [Rhizobiales bacterium]|nr:MFS transporter [Hyphomicrobiales bacterium]